MDVLPAFRRRDVAGRGHYTRLDNDSDSQYSSASRTSSVTRRRRDDRIVLCDRCWIKHERKRASKRCLDCKQNLCTVCAKCDEITRPWWLPSLFAQCWRFFFSKSFIPHSFVELYDDDLHERKDWVHSQEACRIQPIPRVTRNSLGSYRSTASSSGDRFAYDNGSFNEGQDDKVQKTELHPDNLTRSRSFEGFKERRRVRERRTRSVDRMPKKTWDNNTKREEKYESNWDNETILSSLNEADKRSKKVVKGKDIDIELTGEEVKLTVNADEKVHAENKKDMYRKPSCAVKKAKTKRRTKPVSPEPYTEKIFTNVPIWFKRQSSGKDNRQSSENISKHKPKSVSPVPQQSATRFTDRSTDNMSAFGTGSNFRTQQTVYQCTTDRWKTEHHPGTSSSMPDSIQDNADRTVNGNVLSSYIVEEPPDQCSICLEDLPNSESRLLKCSHQIHTKCLRQYLLRTELDFGIRCPVCNQMTMIRDYYAPTELWYRELPTATSV